MTAFLFVFVVAVVAVDAVVVVVVVVAVDAVVVGTLPQSLQIQLLLPFHSFHSFNFAKSHKIVQNIYTLSDLFLGGEQRERERENVLSNFSFEVEVVTIQQYHV